MAKGRKLREPAGSAGQKRRDAMVEAAYSLFIEKGYEGVTLDDIIRVSGGSKSSLYDFFGSKEGVFRAVVESLAEKMITRMQIPTEEGQPTRDALRRIGLTIGELALSDNAINQYRLAVANAKKLPSLSRLWFESGPKTTFDGLAAYLREQDRIGKLTVPNPDRAAVFFFGMIIFKDNMTMSVGTPPPSRGDLEEIVDEAVSVFLAGYGSQQTVLP